MMNRIVRIVCAVVASSAGMAAQSRTVPIQDVVVDSAGVMRWTDSGDEVRLFGVNYTTPFAYAYRAHKRLGLSLKESIDLDVDHMARLGFDAFRVHVWDREVSDSVGRLLANEHLDLLDYLLAKLHERGIRSILTPIAWWGTGWPEPDLATPGFSTTKSKVQLVTDPAARAAQRRYLAEFARHVNPYRRLAYKDDPSIIAMEIVNEPRHPNDTAAVTAYINEMADVLRQAGFRRPIFYNISETWSREQASAVARARIDGVTFQWYPTALVHGRALRGNYSRNVAAYPIPGDEIEGFGSKARMVYEFDAADIGASTMYPLMARSFRQAGMQFAAMFSYDPVQIAWSNTEYPTHFVNILYAPSKAISLMIAGRAFRSLPRENTPTPSIPEGRFGDVRVNANDDLSEWNTFREFLYSNTTPSAPKVPDSLRLIAGHGSSSVVEYSGTGAYFLEYLEPGIWRMEVEPDAAWLSDPFQNASMNRQVSRLYWNERSLSITLPDLGAQYDVRPWSQKASAKKEGSGFTVSPGVYLVTRSGIPRSAVQGHLKRTQRFLAGLYRPAPPPPGISVVPTGPDRAIPAGMAPLTFDIASEQNVDEATLHVRRPGWRGFERIALRRTRGFRYVAVDSSRTFYPGVVEYCVSVRSGKTTRTFPGGQVGAPGEWDFLATDVWSVTVTDPLASVEWFSPKRDVKHIILPMYQDRMRYQVDLGPGPDAASSSLVLRASGLDSTRWKFGFQRSVEEFRSFLSRAAGSFAIVLEAKSLTEGVVPVRVALLMKDGGVMVADGEIGKEWNTLRFTLDQFRPGEALLLPNAYPLFLPRYQSSDPGSQTSTIDMRSCEAFQILIGPARDISSGSWWSSEVAVSGLTLDPGI